MKRTKKNKLISFLLPVAGLAVVFAVGVAIGRRANFQEPDPVGTPNTPPVADQRPVPTPTPTPGPGTAPGSSRPAVQPGSSSAPAGSSAAGGESSSSSAASLPGQGETPGGGEQTLQGTIRDVTTSFISIQPSSGGEPLSFIRETADVSGNLVEGALVELHFIGEIKGTDTSAVFLTRIIVLGPA